MGMPVRLINGYLMIIPILDANSKKTAVWSWGHRNAQGLAFGSNGILYQSEQQDKTDDEVNIIDSARNYGWPKLSGYCDGNYNGLKLANKNVISEQIQCAALNSKDPIYTLFTDMNPGSLGTDYLTWPTVAASSIDVYEKNVIPNWNRSLLVTSLKAGKVFRLHLDAAGTGVLDSSTIPAMRNQGRYRDLCIAPDGIRIYVACDISGQTSGPTGSYNGGGTATRSCRQDSRIYLYRSFIKFKYRFFIYLFKKYFNKNFS